MGTALKQNKIIIIYHESTCQSKTFSLFQPKAFSFSHLFVSGLCSLLYSLPSINVKKSIR